MEIKELSRDNAVELYKAQGYPYIKGKKIKGKEYKTELYSLFLARYKQTLEDDKVQKLQVDYADMIEVVTTLMVLTKTDFKNHLADESQQALHWYKSLSPSKTKLKDARIDLMQKFYELIPMKTEAVRDQLNDIITSLYELVEAHELSFANVEKTRKIMREKLGGFSKGIYIDSVSKVKTSTVEYSV